MILCGLTARSHRQAPCLGDSVGGRVGCSGHPCGQGWGRHGQQGGQLSQLRTKLSRVRGRAGVPQTVGTQGSSWGPLTSKKPQEALERIRGVFLCLLSVHKLEICTGDRSCGGMRKSVFSILHFVKLTNPISGAPFGARPP